MERPARRLGRTCAIVDGCDGDSRARNAAFRANGAYFSRQNWWAEVAGTYVNFARTPDSRTADHMAGKFG